MWLKKVCKIGYNLKYDMFVVWFGFDMVVEVIVFDMMYDCCVI